MTDERLLAPERVPTLTEVVLEAVVETAPAAAATPADHGALVDAVLASLQQRVDLMFEYRVREALTPVLRQLADELVVRARQELGDSLREVVSRAVTQELERHRAQGPR